MDGVALLRYLYLGVLFEIFYLQGIFRHLNNIVYGAWSMVIRYALDQENLGVHGESQMWLVVVEAMLETALEVMLDISSGGLKKWVLEPDVIRIIRMLAQVAYLPLVTGSYCMRVEIRLEGIEMVGVMIREKQDFRGQEQRFTSRNGNDRQGTGNYKSGAPVVTGGQSIWDVTRSCFRLCKSE
ncbi:hypothetical protein Tco_1522504 [Tanacetum coccineum]